MNQAALNFDTDGNLRKRFNQRDRVWAYIQAHGTIERSVAARVLDVYELSSRIGEIEKHYGVTIPRESINYKNSWDEHRHFTRYFNPYD